MDKAIKAKEKKANAQPKAYAVHDGKGCSTLQILDDSNTIPSLRIVSKVLNLASRTWSHL
jgi:hypothetical protein